MQGFSFMPESLSLHRVGSLSKQPQSSRSASWDHMGVAEFTRGMLSNKKKKKKPTGSGMMSLGELSSALIASKQPLAT